MRIIPGRSSIPRHTLLWLRMLIAGVGLAAAQSVPAIEPGSFTFEWSEGRCRLEARDAPVAAVLAEVSETTGVPIQFDKDDPATVTLSLQDMDLEQIIRAVGGNVVLTYVVDPESPDGYRVASVKIDPPADASTRAVAESRQVIGSTAPIPATGDVKYSGIGASIRYSADREGVHLNALTTNAPIVASGITPEDVVIAVNGQPVSTFESISDMTKVIRGPEGTTVTFTVRRPDSTVTDVAVTRQVVEFKRGARR